MISKIGENIEDIEDIEDIEHQLNWLLKHFFEFTQDGIKIREENERLVKYPGLLKYKNVLRGSFLTFEKVKSLISIKTDLSEEDKQIFFYIYDQLFKEAYYAAFVKEYLKLLIGDKKGDIYEILDEIFQKKEKYEGFLTYGYVWANYEGHQINFQKIFSNLNDLSYRARLDREFYEKYGLFSEKNLSFYQERLTEDIRKLLFCIEKELNKDKNKLNKLTEDIKVFNIDNIEEYINYVKKYSIFKILFDRLVGKFSDAEIGGKILILGNKVGKILTNLGYKSLKARISSYILANQNKLNQTNNLEEKQQILTKISVYQNILDLIKQLEEEIKNTDKILGNNFEQYLLFIKGSKTTENLDKVVSMLQEVLKEILQEVKFDFYKDYNIQKEKETLLKNIEKNLNNNLLKAYIDIVRYQNKYGKDCRLSAILKYLNEENIFLNYINHLIEKVDRLEDILEDIENIKRLKEILKEDRGYIKNVVDKLYNFFIKGEVPYEEDYISKAILRIKTWLDERIYDILLGKVEYLGYLQRLAEEGYVSKYRNLLRQMEIITEGGYDILEVLKIRDYLKTEEEEEIYERFIKGNIEKIGERIAYLLGLSITDTIKEEIVTILKFLLNNNNNNNITDIDYDYFNLFKKAIDFLFSNNIVLFNFIEVLNICIEVKRLKEYIDNILDRESEVFTSILNKLKKKIKNIFDIDIDIFYNSIRKGKVTYDDINSFLKSLNKEEYQLLVFVVSRNLEGFNTLIKKNLREKIEILEDNILIYIEIYELYMKIYKILSFVQKLEIDIQVYIGDFMVLINEYCDVNEKNLTLEDLKNRLESLLSINFEYAKLEHCDIERFKEIFLPWIEKSKREILGLGIRKIYVSSHFGYCKGTLNIDSKNGSLESLKEMLWWIKYLQDLEKGSGIQVEIDFFFSNFFKNIERSRYNAKKIIEWIERNIKRLKSKNIKRIIITNIWDFDNLNDGGIKIFIPVDLRNVEVYEYDKEFNRHYSEEKTQELRSLLRELKCDLINL